MPHFKVAVIFTLCKVAHEGPAIFVPLFCENRDGRFKMSEKKGTHDRAGSRVDLSVSGI